MSDIDLSKINEKNYEQFLDQLTPEQIVQLLEAKASQPVPASARPEPQKVPGSKAGEYQYTGPKRFGGTGARELTDYTQGMSGGKLALAGAGKFVDDLISGVSNKAQLLGSTMMTPDQSNRVVSDINARKAEKLKYDRMLMNNPEAMLGFAVPAMAMGAAAAPTPGGQAAMFGTLGAIPSPEPPVSGAWGELAGSGARGALDALTGYGGAKLFQGAGKGYNAARGRYTPEGDTALAYDAAAQRLGLSPAPIGELSPLGVPGQFERLSTNYAERIKEQSDALRSALSKDVPVTTEAGMPGTRHEPMGAWQDELTNAVRERYAQAGKLYDAVDDYVLQNGLGNISPRRTYNKMEQIARDYTPPGSTHDRNPLFARLMDYDPTAFDWLTQLGANASPRKVAMALADGVLPSNYHTMRVAMNKTLNKLTRDAQMPNAPMEVRVMRDEVRGLKEALDADASAWAASNAGNAEAMKLYNTANDFYKTTVAPSVIENPVARKLISKRSPFTSGSQLLNATTGTAGKEAVDLLMPTMSPRGEDMARALQGPLPHSPNPVTIATRTGALPGSQAAANALETGAGMATLGRVGVGVSAPLRTLGTLLGNLSGLSRAEAMKRAYFGANPTGLGARLGYGALQIPEEQLRSTLERKLSLRGAGG